MNKKILIIDDEEELIEILKWSLEAEKFDVEIAENGDSGYRKIKDGGFDIILSDVRMPKFDGINMLKKLKNENVDFPKILFWSGFADISQEDVISLGGTDLIKKPIKIKDLIKRINEELQ